MESSFPILTCSCGRPGLRGVHGCTRLLEEEQESAAHAAAAGGQVPSQVRQMDAVSTGAEQHLRKVWSITGANIGVAATGTLFGMTALAAPVPILVPAFGSLVPLFWLYSTDPTTSSVQKRAALMGSFTFLSGWTLGPMVGLSLKMDPTILPMAFGITGGIFGSMTALSLLLPSGSMQKYGAPLGGGMLVLFGCSIASLFYPHPILSNIVMVRHTTNILRCGSPGSRM